MEEGRKAPQTQSRREALKCSLFSSKPLVLPQFSMSLLIFISVLVLEAVRRRQNNEVFEML